jgi:hypothetical protein
MILIYILKRIKYKNILKYIQKEVHFVNLFYFIIAFTIRANRSQMKQ